MKPLKLFMLMLGCTPKGRHTEQHDVYFTIASNIADTVPGILAFWPEAKGAIHIDAWREVTQLDSMAVEVISRDEQADQEEDSSKLFFINLGGYKEGEFDEFHYKLLLSAPDKAGAIKQAKESAFYKHTRFKGAESHIDDKFGVDVDDFYEIHDILPDEMKKKYAIRLSARNIEYEDELHLGYFKLNNL